MAEGIGISGLQSPMNTAANAAASLGAPPTREQRTTQQPPKSAGASASRVDTGFVAQPQTTPQTDSKVVARLLQQNATTHSPGLAQIPLPQRPDGVPRAVPKKPAGAMAAPRSLDGGRSPLAPESLRDARASVDAIGKDPTSEDSSGALDDAKASAESMPSRHGLVAYTKTSRGDQVYLTQERWMHIRENHMDLAPQPRGKRTTTYWPTKHAVDQPTMRDQDVIGAIVDSARNGTLRNEVRDTRMAEYDLPADQRERFGVSEVKVSMAPDGLVLSAYPAAGNNVLAVYELSQADQAELERVQGATNPPEDSTDDRLFKTNLSATSFG